MEALVVPPPPVTVMPWTSAAIYQPPVLGLGFGLSILGTRKLIGVRSLPPMICQIELVPPKKRFSGLFE